MRLLPIYVALSVMIWLLTGDMGGFMGLLLGMSVITLAEVLDLFIYNGIVKLTLKGHVRL